MKQAWLVEIRLKDWRPLHKKGSRIVTYVEVETTFPKGSHPADVLRSVKLHGFDKFEEELKYKPSMSKLLKELGVDTLPLTDFCAPDVVQLK